MHAAAAAATGWEPGELEDGAIKRVAHFADPKEYFPCTQSFCSSPSVLIRAWEKKKKPSNHVAVHLFVYLFKRFAGFPVFVSVSSSRRPVFPGRRR